MMQGDPLLPQGSGRQSGKIVRRHQERLAIVYIRQSTVQQVERHQESTRLQYGLVDRAVQYGWARETIVVIDDDLGRSGATVEGGWAFSAWSRKSASVMSGWCLASRCRDWRGRAGTGTSCWRSAHCSTR